MLPPVDFAITTPENAAVLWGPVAGYHKLGDVSFLQLLLAYAAACVAFLSLLWLCLLPGYLRQRRLRRLLERHGFETAPRKLPKSLPKEPLGITGKHFPALVKGTRGATVVVVFDYSPKRRPTFTSVAVHCHGSASFVEALEGLSLHRHTEAGWTVCKGDRKVSLERIGTLLAFIPREF